MSESTREREVNTLTPWMLERNFKEVINGDDGSVSCRCPNRSDHARNWEANAALIVCAVNAHQALVEALKSSEGWLEVCASLVRKQERVHVKKSLDAVRAALKLAESN